MLKPAALTIALSGFAVATLIATASPGHALTMQECSAKYKAAQATGNKLKWNEFRKAECAADDAAAPAAKPAATPTAAPAPAPATTAAPKAAEAAKPTVAAKPAAPKPAATMPANVVFPTAIAPQYAKEPAGKARMHTCLDQYKANKAANTEGGLKWIEKGGGYYSECNKRLKG